MNKGYIALVSVLIISAVGAVIVISLLTVGTSAQRMIFTVQEERIAESVSQACANVALMKIRLDAGYLGDETIDIGTNLCNILPIEIDGDTYTIYTEGVVYSILRKSKVVVVRTEDIDTMVVTMTIESWSDVGDF